MTIAFDNTYAQLPNAFYASVRPAQVTQPEFLRVNPALAELLGLDPEWLQSAEGLAVFSGNEVPNGAEPLAMAYCGHQFGNLVPQLGDGRAVLLGEVVGADGIRRDLQLKGAGRTPFSRQGDGLSALGPVVREYVVSEAMAALGVPTTRALAAVASGDRVYRETIQPGGVFTRVAKSHIRVGTFQWFAIREDHNNLQRLADYTIERLYPEAREEPNPYRALMRAVVERQADLIAYWMSLGFIHGVMNTDNMNISGETIDYGPCAFMDAYHPQKKFSSIDHGGRYAYGNQASIGQWNLARFAETLLPLLADEQEAAIEWAQSVLGEYQEIFQAALRQRFAAKIGLREGSVSNWELVESLLEAMAAAQADFTLVFRHLADALETDRDAELETCFQGSPMLAAWLERWRQALVPAERPQAVATMRATNPILIPRNHRIEQAIQAANIGDYRPFQRLNDALQSPFENREAFAEYEAPPKPEEVVGATFCGT